MIRATLGLTLVLLGGVSAVWWTARNLDPMRVLERIAPARVRTVDLTGFGSFLREAAATPPVARPPARPPAPSPRPSPRGRVEEPGDAATASSGPASVGADSPPPDELAARAGPPAASFPGPGAAVARPAPPPGANAGATGAAEPSARVPAPPPLHPDDSAELIRRMLALYGRAGEPE